MQTNLNFSFNKMHLENTWGIKCLPIIAHQEPNFYHTSLGFASNPAGQIHWIYKSVRAGIYPVTCLRALFRLLFHFLLAPNSSWTLVRLDGCHLCLIKDLFWLSLKLCRRHENCPLCPAYLWQHSGPRKGLQWQMLFWHSKKNEGVWTASVKNKCRIYAPKHYPAWQVLLKATQGK